jgi:DUF2934 family protein
MKTDSGFVPVSGTYLTIEDQIRERAYELFEARGKEAGHELEDWLQAEAEITGSTLDAAAA